MERDKALLWRATQISLIVVDFDYLEGGALLVQTCDGEVLLAESKGGEYVYHGGWFPCCNCSEFWEVLVDILLGIRQPAQLPPYDPHEQAHDDW
jgi:hypothetical protein